jgi:hypothetical protein
MFVIILFLLLLNGCSNQILAEKACLYQLTSFTDVQFTECVKKHKNRQKFNHRNPDKEWIKLNCHEQLLKQDVDHNSSIFPKKFQQCLITNGYQYAD